MLDLGPHAVFIISAYGVTALTVGALVLATIGDDLRQRHRLAELERQGVTRRSAKTAAARSEPEAALAAAGLKPARKAEPNKAKSTVKAKSESTPKKRAVKRKTKTASKNTTSKTAPKTDTGKAPS